jgi:hypothetical protein
MASTPTTYQIKKWPLTTSRFLVIDPLYMELEGPLTNQRFTKEDIEGFRFGITRFYLRLIPISKTYNIEIKNSQGKIMRIRMHSFFWIGDKRLRSQYIQVYKSVYKSYFEDMAIHYARLLIGGMTYELGGVFLTKEGVLIKKDKPLVPWMRIGLQSYFNSCSIYDLANPSQYRSFDYWHDWNATLLRAIVNFKLQKND